MGLTLKKNDFSKKGWQERRHTARKGSGMGKALEACGDLQLQGADDVARGGKSKDALAKGVAVTKAIATARAKLGDIKDATDKRDTKELLDAYEQAVAGFADAPLSADRAAKCKGVLDELERRFQFEGIDKLEAVEKLVDTARAALKKGDAAEATRATGPP